MFLCSRKPVVYDLSSEKVTERIPILKECITIKQEDFVDQAIQWALGKVGSTEYRLRCLAFVEDAYEQGNRIEIFGGSNAKESADMYEAWRNTTTPPKGSFVFYDCSGLVQDEVKHWGHVGLCVGNDEVIHAWDKVRVDSYMEIENLKPAPGWTKPQYIGWVPIERILEGFHKKDWEQYD
ncbi:NlpC/P60 family protein [Paenibacillus sp. UNC451MF]|uniref:NlpC/P60 family protein n=1 Tax=Paenibacillus sp. UNC451MF TaxID=1449063 RepID=UPI0018CC4877|nr:NlpC/P60 family protein [Paenibacillus sp. UNC451MF]